MADKLKPTPTKHKGGICAGDHHSCRAENRIFLFKS
jgi:hypothetical protein